MTPTERTGNRRVDCFVRETLPAPMRRRCERIRERLAALDATDRIDEYEVHAWPKRIESADPADRATRDAYLAFERWADERDVRLRPFFATRNCYSMETGDRGDWLVLPVLCLAVYEDGDLASVYPHVADEGPRSVMDCLDALDADPGEDAGGPPSVAVGVGAE